MKHFLSVAVLAGLAVVILGMGVLAADSAVQADSRSATSAAPAASAAAAAVPSGAAAPGPDAKFLAEPDRWSAASIDQGRLTPEALDAVLAKLALSDEQKKAVAPIQANYVVLRNASLLLMEEFVKQLPAARKAGDGAKVDSLHWGQEDVCKKMNNAWKNQMDGLAKTLQPEQVATLREEVAATQVLPARPGALLVQAALDNVNRLELTDDQVKALTELLAFAKEPVPQEISAAIVFPEGTPPEEVRKEVNRAAADERDNLVRSELGKILKGSQGKHLAGFVKKLPPQGGSAPAAQSATPSGPAAK